MPWVELGERANLSPSACQRRVQSLIDRGIITGFSVALDPVAMGYDIEAYLSVRVERHDIKRAKEFRKAIANYPEVLTCRMMTGDIDFLLARDRERCAQLRPFRRGKNTQPARRDRRLNLHCSGSDQIGIVGRRVAAPAAFSSSPKSHFTVDNNRLPNN